MPIYLDDIATIANATTKAATPKFFSKELTGSGKAVGLLNERVLPGRYALGAGAHTFPSNALNEKSKSTGNSVTTHTFPTNPLTQYSLERNLSQGLTLPVPHSAESFHVTGHATTLPYDAFVDLTPQGVLLYEDNSGDRITRDLNILYRMEVFVVAAGSKSERVKLVSSPLAAPYNGAPMDPSHEFVMVDWSYAPLDDIEDLIKEATGRAARAHNSNNTQGTYVNTDDLAEWMGEYKVYDRLSLQAEQWSDMGVADVVCDHITELFAHGTPPNESLNLLASQLRYLETYGVSLNAYRQIHTVIHSVCPPDMASVLSKQNMNLLMNHTLNDLEAMKAQLPAPPVPATLPVLPAHFSTQQRNAITTTEPLALVTAGAGTGKSTTILERIAYLVACGVDPEEVTVLSFTNAAADNIKDKNPAVGSMTISRMIHDIYTLNHPTHELSSIDTILNSMDIRYPNDDMVRAFRRLMMDIAKNQTGATTAMNSFIEKYYDEVIAVLDTIKQTCLELEIIIAYQRIDTMLEPAHVQSRFLIIDEVQDNSIFEFIYMLKYVAKHKENLFIVGDASQTLYEFRSANPKALNALEGSGVFACYQLTTNYRSNQEILDFANLHLAAIEANQISNMRLQANSLAMPTAQTFQDKVNLHYELTPKLRGFKEELPTILGLQAGNYIRDALARGEQVAFLSHTRSDVMAMENKLKEMFPGQHIANLTSDKSYSTTVFSQYIKLFWNDVCQVDPANAAFVVHKGINDNLDQLTNNADKAKNSVAKMTSEWWTENHSVIGGWVNLYQAGQMTKDAFMENLLQNLLDYEISRNTIKQSLMNQRNRERKEKNLQANAKLFVSTIHGAKGLEFDNVVVIHKFDAQMPEDAKRMYYVAFTRAMKSLFVLSYGTVKKPRIESDYDLMVAALVKRDQLNALRAQGVDPDTMSEDDVEAALALLFPTAPAQDAAGDDDDDDKSAAVTVTGSVDEDLLAQATAMATTPEEAAPAADPVATVVVAADAEEESVDDGSAFVGATN